MCLYIIYIFKNNIIQHIISNTSIHTIIQMSNCHSKHLYKNDALYRILFKNAVNRMTEKHGSALVFPECLIEKLSSISNPYSKPYSKPYSQVKRPHISNSQTKNRRTGFNKSQEKIYIRNKIRSKINEILNRRSHNTHCKFRFI